MLGDGVRAPMGTSPPDGLLILVAVREGRTPPDNSSISFGVADWLVAPDAVACSRSDVVVYPRP